MSVMQHTGRILLLVIGLFLLPKVSIANGVYFDDFFIHNTQTLNYNAPFEVGFVSPTLNTEYSYKFFHGNTQTLNYNTPFEIGFGFPALNENIIMTVSSSELGGIDEPDPFATPISDNVHFLILLAVLYGIFREILLRKRGVKDSMS